MRTSWHRVAFVTLLSFVAAVAQIGFAYAVFRLFFGTTQSDGNALPWGLTETSAIIGLVALSLLAAVLPFVLQKLIIRYTALYMSAGIGWVRSQLFDVRSRYALFGTGLGRGEIARLMTTEVRYAGQSYASVLQIIFPGLLTVGGLTALGIVRPVWTVAILLVLLPSLVVAARLVLSGVRMNERLRSAAAAHSRASNRFVTSISRHFSANGWDSADMVLPPSETQTAYVEAYRRRLVLGVAIGFAMDLVTFAVVALVAVLILTGRLDLGTAVGVLLYGLVLRFVLSKLSQCMNLSIGVVSQLPFYANYLRARTELADHELEDGVEDAVELEDVRRLFIHPEGAGWLAARDYLGSLVPPGALYATLGRSVLLTGSFSALFDSYALTFQRPSDDPSETMIGDFPASERRRGDISRLDALGESVSREEMENVHAVVRFLASVRYAESDAFSARAIFINATDYVRLTLAERDWLDARLEGSHTVFVAPDTRFHDNLMRSSVENAVGKIPIYVHSATGPRGPFTAKEARNAMSDLAQRIETGFDALGEGDDI